MYITTNTGLYARRGTQKLIENAHLESPGKQGKHSIIRLTQTAHHGMDQLLEQGISQIGMAVQKDHQPVAVHHRQLALREGHHGGGASLAVEQRQLPEQLAFAELAK